MAFVPVLSFVLLLLFGSANTWAACQSKSFSNRFDCNGSSRNIICKNSFSISTGCSNGCNTIGFWSDGGTKYCSGAVITSRNCDYFGDGTNPPRSGYFGGSYVACDTEREADSLDCVQDLLKYWDSAAGECKDFVPDTTYFCENAGIESVLTGGYPKRANIISCIDGDCHKTSSLAGTCQDWGFCPEGVESCEVSKDSTGRRPCTRSGAGTTSTTVCYYQCVDGRQLRCKPTSTEYVAGSIYVGVCPERPPTSCDPPPNYSSSSGASSSGSSGSSGDNGGGYWSSGSGGGSGGGSEPQPDYMPILAAIHDTLVNANRQRKALEDYAADALPVIKGIEQNTFDASRIDNQINNRLSTLQENGVEAGKSTKKSIDSTVSILDEINRYLKHDSLVVYSHDTSYNPLLRDIKAAIDNQTDSISVVGRASVSSDSVGRIPPVDTSLLNRALYQLANNFAPADSVKRRHCAELNDCLSTHGGTSDVCFAQFKNSLKDCTQGGSPVDVVANAEMSVLETLWKGFFGEDSTPLKSTRPDTNYVSPPAADSAKRSIVDVIAAMFSADSTAAVLQKVNAMKDSVERSKNDSASIQPDSLWLDSAEAAQYVQNALVTAPTVDECFVCHAELGTLGGLAPDGLVIHVDFANVGGFNICAIIRAVVRIIGFVVCLSLTLGSWAAAFGYNPKNDA